MKTLLKIIAGVLLAMRLYKLARFILEPDMMIPMRKVDSKR